ncbi:MULTISPECIES: GNAT family N-acetyltransferase [Cyanophyceae]|uniref:GNAT family N-acetyltransferase n=1 Tax=Cyanophyceae TaxID=3028117 RepID=UPI00168964D0|nr:MULTISPECIES: GNAT family N-acetyltransferase [Cyanophyceae]MBD1918224.1 GNAT family N-acetyltransferase [Phormidium sp. FACHB-77]MBD2030256.1 GNAT family N-acetyltransferase [Phormidium sp. FACHB-322]MBD2051372.1 GNAT family N-acetyltransferase [Leptolyngbya sp. FACHB-60]
MDVFQARFEHLEAVAKLFDQYRVFYQAPSDFEAAKTFISKCLQENSSTIFVVCHHDKIIGFTQLYPTFSSVSMKRVWVLNDLFVEEAYRNRGMAGLLLNAAAEFAKTTDAARIILATQASNTPAQSLYESRGYCRDEAFYHYTLSLA